MRDEKLGYAILACVKTAVIFIDITFIWSLIKIGLLANRERQVKCWYNKVRQVGCCKISSAKVVLAEMLKVSSYVTLKFQFGYVCVA
jgi:hypothetical protein